MPAHTTDNSQRTITPLEAIADPGIRETVRLMRERDPGADPTALLPEVDPRRIPKHIAIIMDGNGRWANERDLPRVFGHRNGAVSVRTALKTISALGVECLTLYSFSLENWKRPADEVGQLMQLYLAYMDGEREKLVENNIRFRQIGRREGLPTEALDALDRTIEATASCTGPTLCLAVNYGSRDEITNATRTLAQRVRDGEIEPEAIDEELLATHLHTTGLPDPDLLIRTAGEFRISNFLLWQISYAELYVTPVLWPDFGQSEMLDAVRDFAGRERRFGGLNDTPPA